MEPLDVLCALGCLGLLGCGSPSGGAGPGNGAAGSGNTFGNDRLDGNASDSRSDSGASPMIGTCPVFPANNAWNQDVSALPLRSDSDAIIDSIGRSAHAHPDFGTEWEGAPIGIPFVTVRSSQAAVPIRFTPYGDESDSGPYPVPKDAPVEGGADGDGDRHVLVIDTDTCHLYELDRAFLQSNGSWDADAGAVFDLSTNDQRPLGWTSADAAGLPIFPGLVRYAEVVEQGALRHAVRFTVSRTQRGLVAPARHYASNDTATNLPPMGLRLRMKQGYDCSGYSSIAQVICDGLKRFGLMLADNGSNWYLSGAPDPRWDDAALGDLKQVPGDAFEAVDTGPIQTY